MSATRPHYLLFSEASHESPGRSVLGDGTGGRWKFVLEALDGSAILEASDDENGLTRERLELLSVVRGLEALPQPSRVTLITASRYVGRGLRFGLAEWRENNWQWEHFGEMSQVKNADLWQRLDRAMRIHDVQIRTLRFDGPHGGLASSEADSPQRPRTQRPKRAEVVPGGAQRAGHWMKGWLGRARVSAAQLL